MNDNGSKNVYIESNGCAVLRHDTQRYSRYFRLNGWKETDNPTEADLILMTSCGVTNETENEAVDSITRLEGRLREGATLVLGGCLPGINRDRLEQKFKAVIFGPKQEGVLDDLIRPTIPLEEVIWDGEIVRDHSFGPPGLKYTEQEEKELKEFEELSTRTDNPNFLEIYNYMTRGRYFWQEKDLFEIKVAEGCNYNCTFCAIKNARGKLKSIVPQRIKKEFDIALAKGSKKILLTGDEVGEYGSDTGSSLFALLNDIVTPQFNSKIALRYVSPSSLIDWSNELMPFFEKNQIYYFCTAIQSASPEVLKRIGRPNNLLDLSRVVSQIDSVNHLVYKHTQVIVGFPGETKEDFKRTLDYVENSGFDYMGVTKYSARPNTRAFALEQIPPAVIQERYLEATALRDKLRSAKLKDKVAREALSAKNIKR